MSEIDSLLIKIGNPESESQSSIVNVLKSSLGEQSSPKNINVWNWKHLQNPFGPSLLATGSLLDNLVGVRAFMSWKWKQGSTQFTAFRAVDTAVLPEYQGKGIFTILTKSLVNFLETDISSNSFIFNTPNKKSFRGYLKLGWKSAGRLPVSILPAFLFRKDKNSDKYNHTSDQHDYFFFTKVDGLKHLCSSYNESLSTSEHLFTPKSPEYLKWRYLDCPFKQYWTYGNDKFFIAGYPKIRGGFLELRIVELICDFEAIDILNKVFHVIAVWIKNSKAHVVTISPMLHKKIGKFGITLEVGPELTILPMCEEESILFSKWNYTLGDLELF